MLVEKEVIVSKRIKHSQTFNNAGFLAYFKLTLSIWNQFFNNETIKKSKFLIKCGLFFKLFFKSFWWIIIKPFGQIFTKNVKIEGSFTSYNGIIPKKHSLVKNVTWKLFFIPIIVYKSNISFEDWTNLFK
jgi:hypothetical protein